MSKAALDQLTRCSALELAGRGVRVNSVNPGVIVTELHRRAGMDPDKYRQVGSCVQSQASHCMLVTCYRLLRSGFDLDFF